MLAPGGAPEGGPPPHAADPADRLDAYGTSQTAGLSSHEAAQRLLSDGPNLIETAGGISIGAILADQFRGAIFWLLAAAAILALILGDTFEAAAIIVVLVLNGSIGFFTEFRAVKSMAALRKLTRTRATVRRDGVDRSVDASELVRGDIAVLAAGDVIPADLRVLEARDLQADESLLTGESVPVAKSPEPVAEDTPVAERTSMLYRGASLTRGSGLGLVEATGGRTELAAIARMVGEATEERSPLEARLDRLGNLIAVTAIVGIAVLALAGIAAGREIAVTVKTAIALAVAAVPEGLPIVATLALARGMWRMAARNALINRLSAVETLGSTNLLMTDKTGTLTENRMAAVRVFTATGDHAPDADDLLAREALRIGVLCNEVREDGTAEGEAALTGDPMELALIEAGARAGLARAEALAAAPLIETHPFDPDLKMMATVHGGPDGDTDGGFTAVKGAPEAVLASSAKVLGDDGPRALTDTDRNRINLAVEAAAGDGLRTLAVARGDAEGDPYAALTFLGLVALLDPARADAAEAVRALRRAGIRVVMVTGDHPATAAAIARTVGLTDGPARVCAVSDFNARNTVGDTPAAESERITGCDVFARFEPRAKLDLARLYRSDGAVVAMTGDGVNDAPALKEADIGIAMGKRGTQVAAEAADIVLRDDRLGSIVAAVHEGRIVYGNIVLFVRYLFTCNLSEILLIGGAIAVGLPMPLLPLQILFLNLVTDVFPAIALGYGDGRTGVMSDPPRDRNEPLISRRVWGGIAVHGLLLTAVPLSLFLYLLSDPEVTYSEANTAAFLTIGLAQLWFVFAMHHGDETVLASQVSRNRVVWGAVVLSAALLGAALLVPALSAAMDLAMPSGPVLMLSLAAGLAPLVVAEAFAALARTRSR